MTRAEQVANELFPRHIDEPDSFAEAVGRQAVIDGYEQAEKDLALTWKDMKRIVEISDELIKRIDAENIEHYLILEQAYYEEVLRGFNNTRENHD